MKRWANSVLCITHQLLGGVKTFGLMSLWAIRYFLYRMQNRNHIVFHILISRNLAYGCRLSEVAVSCRCRIFD